MENFQPKLLKFSMKMDFGKSKPFKSKPKRAGTLPDFNSDPKLKYYKEYPLKDQFSIKSNKAFALLVPTPFIFFK